VRQNVIKRFFNEKLEQIERGRKEIEKNKDLI